MPMIYSHRQPPTVQNEAVFTIAVIRPGEKNLPVASNRYEAAGSRGDWAGLDLAEMLRHLKHSW